ncbi:MAG: nucleoside phosphorylase [Candidatus Dormibacteria bacterium]
MRQYHIQLEEGEIGEYVLMPGDPGRCERIAQHFTDAVHVRSNREFTTYTGTLDGVKVSAVSTGIGGPSTAIAAEELFTIGARTMIRVGTCGGLTDSLRLGDAVLVQAAIRNEGTSHQYVPAEFPAVADFDVLLALQHAAQEQGLPHELGIVQCNDAIYSEIAPETVPVESMIRAKLEAWKRAGSIAAEMESSTLFVIGAVRGFRTGAVMAVVNTAQSGDGTLPGGVELPIDVAIRVAVGGVKTLIAQDAARLAAR